MESMLAGKYMDEKKDHHMRVSKKFNDEIEKIKDERLKLGKDKDRIKSAIITDLIVKHMELWPKLKKEIIEFDLFKENRR